MADPPERSTPNPEEMTVPSFIGPLQWTEARRDLAPILATKPTPGGLITFISDPMRAPRMSRFVAAYEEISEQERKFPLYIAPFEVGLLNKIIWPLRSAKASFVLANYVGTIALCGMIGEMVAVLTFDLEKPDWDYAQQQRHFRKTFEQLDQAQRVKELKKLGLIGEDWVRDFTALRDIRRRYLHLFSQGSETLPKDALAAYRIALGLVSRRIGQGVDNGRLVLDSKLVEYLRKRGLLNATIEATGPVVAVPLEDIDKWPPDTPPVTDA